MDYGGPDPITSFALEDNEFWLRNLFGSILEVIDACYCFLLTLLDNKLWFPTILVFIVGNVKYAERTIALYLANFNRFGSPVHDFEEPNAEVYYYVYISFLATIPTRPGKGESIEFTRQHHSYSIKEGVRTNDVESVGQLSVTAAED
ncbi:hypothetical protein FEM48_Zijuj01G0012900 [Ziziphus jujuba var. spinosa]|uniref:DUF4220 domain-containing protein n=1 Tax=Ziziphus jujuba var. spinosa TaxID=714518 RepID=A0A978VYB0_ZIZJJ|nr:hypothetical protein FEM48_Zijuj01G0012900 [Ziziphus jujuba var. spinosa]